MIFKVVSSSVLHLVILKYIKDTILVKDHILVSLKVVVQSLHKQLISRLMYNVGIVFKDKFAKRRTNLVSLIF